MKKWTEKPASSSTVISTDFSEEYGQFKSVFNGGLDRTAIPASYFTKAHVKDETFHKVHLFVVGENTKYIQTSGFISGASELICQNYNSYPGGEYLAHVETVSNLKAGWVHIEVSSMFFNSTEKLKSDNISLKEQYVKLVWNGETIAEAGPFTKTLYSYRISTGAYTTDGNGTLSIYIRGRGADANDTATSQTYHWWNMQGLICARWR
jgi:hypothetical protein